MSKLKKLPLSFDVESKRILKKAIDANRLLGELKGIVQKIPNKAILLNTLTLTEAKDSSGIENIITTHDELYKADLFSEQIKNRNLKEVLGYSEALEFGYGFVKEKDIITVNLLVKLQQIITGIGTGIRKQAGTILKNDQTGEVVYEPPQDYNDVIDLLSNIEKYINEPEDDLDPLVRMAIIHYQFESIHPFYDGNGRTGRILNILYLVLNGLIDLPVLYLSRYIIRNKDRYYELFRLVNREDKWDDWISYILDGIIETSSETIYTVNEVLDLMSDFKYMLRDKMKLPYYSKDLLESLFKHPYTKIEYLASDLKIHRNTAGKYLNELSSMDEKYRFINKRILGKNNYYVNVPLLEIFLKK